MKLSSVVAVLATLMPMALAAQRRSAAPDTVLFVCEHGTVRSLLAKVMFERYAKEAGLSVVALSRGTNADSLVPPWMMAGLTADSVSLGTWRPQMLRPMDLVSASLVVSFDVPSSATASTRASRVQWDGLPSVRENYSRGRDAIRVRVQQLVDSLKNSRRSAR